ncbi:MAG: amidohydrolase family protein [Planctomycetota bacterium]
MGFRSIIAAVAAACTLAGSAIAQDYDRFVFVKAGKVITVSGEEIERGDIIIEDGKVSLVGLALDPPAGARIIEARDQTVMPGLIVSRTREGLPSYSRRGTHADRSAADEVYYDELDFEPMLEHGVTAVAFYPAGRGIPGVASVYRTGGAEEERLLRRSGYVRATMASLKRDKKTLRDAFNKARSELDKVEKAREEWEKKQAAKKAEAAKKGEGDKPQSDTPQPDKPKPEQPKPDRPKPEDKAPTPPEESPDPEQPPKDAPSDDEKPSEPEAFEPPEIDKTVRPLARMIEGGGPRLMIELSGAAGLLHAEDAIEKHEKVRPAYYVPRSSSTDFERVVDHLGEARAKVLTTPSLSELAYTDVRFNLPGALAASGAEVSLTPSQSNATGLRRYRANIAGLARSGLTREDAIKAMTLNPAKLLNIADKVGSIEPERSADLIFLTGDPLDPHTRVDGVMIEGVMIWERDDADN